MANDSQKEQHSSTLTALLFVARVLPLACKSEGIINHILFDRRYRNFHEVWTLDGWNDGIIQPVRDAVLDYYKVCAPISLPPVRKTHSTELLI